MHRPPTLNGVALDALDPWVSVWAVLHAIWGHSAEGIYVKEEFVILQHLLQVQQIQQQARGY